MTTSSLHRSFGDQVKSESIEARRPSSPGTEALNGNVIDDEAASAASNYGGSTNLNSVVNMLRNSRSNAPAPSEFSTASAPLLREIRARSGFGYSSRTRSTSQREGGSFTTSFEDIGKIVKPYNDTLGELQQLGVSHDVALPELVLVGDQSAGKSSLMSGLANLDLPRSEGTCTRCPLHIRVSRNTDWSCRVSLRKEYVFQPPADRSINETDVTEEDPFFPWHKMPNVEIHEFKSMHDKNQIEDVLRWAQIAILNDDKPSSLFVPGSGSIATQTPIARAAEETVAKFSPNIVALEIRGPDLPDLSFYDMPGIFQNPADAKDDYLVSVVRNLSKSYIQHSSAIIICSMPMNSDAENSSTFGLTRRLKASERTIGVLTKADLLPESGSREQWLEIMTGKTHQTGFGYFVTSRPQGRKLDELKMWEAGYFESQTWPAEFRPFINRCGVEKLKEFLSGRLGEEFLKNLPSIKQKVKQHLDKINRQLATLPELPDNMELEIKTGLMAFAKSAEFKLDQFVSRFNTLPNSFRDCILHIKPKFTLKDKSDFPVFEISDDESDAASTTTSRNRAATTPTSKRRAATASNAATPSKRARLDSASVNGSTPTHSHLKHEESEGILRGANGAIPFGPPPSGKKLMLPEPFGDFTDVGRGFRTLGQIREQLEMNKIGGLPELTSNAAYQNLILESVRPWKGPMDVFMKQAMREMLSELEGTLTNSLEKLKKRFIYKEARKYLRACLDEHRKETEQALALLYGDEMHCTMTFSDDAFKDYKEKELKELTRFRHYMRMKAVGADPGRYIPGEQLHAEKLAQDTKKREAEALKLGPDRFAREIEVVAYCRGYYRLAALRFVDKVSHCIICRMIPALKRRLPDYLEEKLGLRSPGATDVFVRLLEEDEGTARRRIMLKDEKKKFDKALDSIEMLEASAAAEGVEDVSSSVFESLSTGIATQPEGCDGQTTGLETDEV